MKNITDMEYHFEEPKMKGQRNYYPLVYFIPVASKPFMVKWERCWGTNTPNGNFDLSFIHFAHLIYYYFFSRNKCNELQVIHLLNYYHLISSKILFNLFQFRKCHFVWWLLIGSVAVLCCNNEVTFLIVFKDDFFHGTEREKKTPIKQQQ